MDTNEQEILNASEKTTEIKKCPNCGANLVFNPEKQNLSCEHCGTEVEITQVNQAAEQAFSTIIQDAPEWNETHVFRCSNCGSKEVLDKKDISRKCSYCGTTNIVETQELSGKKPTGVVPFKLSIQQAANAVYKWIKARFFAPKAFKKSAQPEAMRGIYNPAFTFDTQTFSRYDGRLGKYYYTTVTRNGKTTRVRHTRWFDVHGSYDRNFDDILIQASATIAQKSLDKIAPFDTNNSKEYTKDYLNGFSANQYSKDGNQCWKEAQGPINSTIRQGILSKYSHDVVQYLNVNTQHSNITYKYLLLPIYVGYCNYKEKNYNFFVNGLNGRVTGKTPISILKVTILVLLIAAAVAAVILFVGPSLNQ